MSMRKILWTAAMSAGLMVGLMAGVAAQSEPSTAPTTAPGAEDAAPPADLVALPAPPEVDGVGWAEVSVRGGAEIEAENDERAQAEWGGLLDGTGATYAQASQLNAQATDPESGETIGFYSAIRIADADESQLREALFATLRAGDEDEEFLFEEAEIGGKDVMVVTLGADDEQAIVYVSGDTAHLMDLPTDQLAAVLGSLP